MHKHGIAFLYIKKKNSCIRISSTCIHIISQNKKNSFHLMFITSQLITQHTLRTWSMSWRATDELQQGQELLREEVNRLKSQMSLLMHILKDLLKKEGNPIPFAAVEMVTSLCSSSVTAHQRQPQVVNLPVHDFTLGCHPRPLISRPPL